MASENRPKARWTPNMLHRFCDICIKAIGLGMRPRTHFTKQGWQYVGSNFHNETGVKLKKRQLKNKWDAIKKDWKIWKQLLSRVTGVGWSPMLRTIDATEEWWATSIQSIPGCKKFRRVGIHPNLCQKYDTMFLNTVATGSYAWAPSSGHLVNEDDKDDYQTTFGHGIGEMDLKEGSGDSEEGDEFEHRLAREGGTLRSIGQGSWSTGRSSGKRKIGAEAGSSKEYNKKKKSTSVGQMLSEHVGRIVSAIETRNSIIATPQNLEPTVPGITMCIKELTQLLTLDSPLFLFAVNLFKNSDEREIFTVLPEQMKVAYLTEMYESSRRT